MSVATLVLGESGTGKTTSLRNMCPDDVLMIQLQKKALPFSPAGWKLNVVKDWRRIKGGIKKAKELGKSIVVIDDFQYLMAKEFMSRATEVGFQKFTEIAQHAFEVIEQAAEAEDDLRVYVLSHTDQSDTGKVKCKTIGKMLDDKITLEGMFPIVLRTHVDGDSFMFSTQNDGNDTVKSPMGMFDSIMIENDLNEVDLKICEFYNIER